MRYYQGPHSVQIQFLSNALDLFQDPVQYIPYGSESSCLLGLPLALEVPQTSLDCGGLHSLGELVRHFIACLSVGF